MAMRKMAAGRLIKPPMTAPGMPKSAKGAQSRVLQNSRAMKSADADDGDQGGQRQRRGFDRGGVVAEHAHDRDIAGRAGLADTGEQRGHQRQARRQGKAHALDPVPIR